jgi:acyl carrier protein
MTPNSDRAPASASPVVAASAALGAARSPNVALLRDVLARHLDGSVADLHPALLLDLDLDLTPLELVLVAVELEEREHVNIPVEGLSDVHTVGELFRYVAANATRAQLV